MSVNRKEFLGNSYIELLDTFGDELTVVNAARVSFGIQKDSISSGDEKLLRFLIKHKHYSPLRQVVFRFRLKTLEAVMRQAIKHIIGADWFAPSPSHNMSWNEISGRYKPVLEYYYPDKWRLQSSDNKQCSDGFASTEQNEEADRLFKEAMDKIKDTYKQLVDIGIAKEQARLILPLNQITFSCFTMSFQAVMNFLSLRDKPDSQYEIQMMAKAIKELVKEQLPVLYKIWEEEHSN